MQTDMTQGKIWRLMLDFALPIMLGMLLQMLYNTVDGIVVGNAAGEAALVMTLAFRVIIAYIMAGTAISCRAIWYAMGLDFVVGTGSYIIRLLGGRWKNKAVVQ